MLGAFRSYSFGISRNQASAASYGRATKKDMPVFFISVHGKVSTGVRRVLARHYRLLCIVSRKKRKCPPERPSDEERLRGGWDPRRKVWRGTFFRKAAPWETVDAFFEALLWFVVVSSPQCGENTAFFFGFPLGGLHCQGIFPVIPLELQGKKHLPFSITQPFLKLQRNNQ